MRLTVFVGAAYVLASLRRATERAALADIDHLTGTANARAFKELARKEILRSRRYGHPLTVVYVDLDGFKAINDTRGHDLGDQVLRQTAAALVQNLRESDVVGRVGGDEFIVLMPETGYEAANYTLHRLQGRLLAKMQENVWPITFSLGAATFAIPPQSVEDVVGTADRLMYQAKHVGGNTIRHEKIAEGAWLSRDAA